jgi:hypothetical protein
LKKDVGGRTEALKTAACDVEVKEHHVHGRKSKKANKKYVCSCCGKKGRHDFTNCKFKEKNCNIFTMKGHLSKMCSDAENNENDHDDKVFDARFIAYMNSESQDDSKKHSRILRGRFQD